MSGTERRLLLASPGTRVLLTGAGTYASDSPLPEVGAVPHTIADLGRCLVERAGLDPACLTTLIDPRTPMELGAALVEAAEQATDVLLIYYAGHGLIGADNELYLATQATGDLTRGIAAYQALPYAMLRQALAQCTAPIVVVVLDCCFSGRATPLGHDAARRLLNATPQGTYLLAAAGRDQGAFAPPGRRHTAFTGALIDLLTNGDPTAPALLTLDDIYRCLSRTLPEQGYPAPRRQATDDGDRRPLAPNPASPSRQTPRTGKARPDGHATDTDGGFSPYRGLAVFTAEDADYFFGRDDLTRALVDRVSAQITAGGPLVVTGPSGSGKSSLLRAGLIATLRRTTDTEVTLLTPGPDPVGTLAARLAHLDGSRPADLRARLENDPDALRSLVAGTIGDGQAVIVVDQFEELFTACADERQRQIFIQALHALCRQCAVPSDEPTASAHVSCESVGVVLGLRADFFGHCAAYQELLPALEHAMVVGPMSSAQLRQAIEGPARRAGLTLEPGLVELILQDLGTNPDTDGDDRSDTAAGVLPLLSHALLVTWQHRHGRMLTMTGYRATGGIYRALARTADTTLEHLDLGGRAIARQMLTRLVGLGDGQDDTRRIVPLVELLPGPESAEYRKARQVLDRFVKARLLTVDAGTVQLAHEALIRAWPQLRLWIDTDRSSLLVYQQLSQDAAEWHRHDRDPAYLYQGTRLANAQQAVALWQTDPGRYPALSGTARDFLNASEATANRRTRRRRLTVGAMAVSLVLALTGAGTAGKLAADAATERARSLSRLLAAQSESVAAVNIRLARQLATAAWDLAQTDEARVSLIRAFISPERAVLTHRTGLVSAIAFSPDGTQLVTAGDDRTVRLWQMPSGEHIATLNGHTAPVRRLAFNPDGTQLVTVGDDGTIRLWQMPSGKRVATLRHRLGFVNDVDFSPKGSQLATADGDRTVRLREVPSGEPIAALTGHTEPVRKVAFSPKGTYLATVGDDHTVRLWDTATRKTHVSLTGHRDFVAAVAFSHDETQLATAEGDGTVHLWEVLSGELITTLTGHTGAVRAIAFSPDGTHLATAGHDGTIRLWDISLSKAVVFDAHGDYVHAIAFSHDATKLATAGDDGTARLWEVPSGRRITTLTGHTGPVHVVAFSPDGKVVATAGSDSTARLWDAHSGTHITTLNGHAGPIRKIAFSPKGPHLATAGDDGTTRLWEVPSGKLIATRIQHVRDIAFSPRGTHLATVGLDHTARLWEVPSGKLVAALTGHTKSVNNVAFNPKGTHLATVGDDGTARLWEVPSGKLIATLTGHTKYVNIVAFSPEGTHLATASSVATIRIWNVNLPPDPFRAVCGLVGDPMTRQDWARYVPEEPYRRVCP